MSFTVQTNTIELHSALTPSPEVFAMLRNYLKYFVMTPLLLIFGEIHPARVSRVYPIAHPKVTQTLGDNALFGYSAGP